MSNNNSVSEQELQEWLDQVHFGSCCSDLNQGEASAPVCQGNNEQPQHSQAEAVTNTPTVKKAP